MLRCFVRCRPALPWPSCRRRFASLRTTSITAKVWIGKFDLPRIAKVLMAEKPDIVALQEVDQKTRRASGVDQPAELARLTGMKVVFGRNIDFEGGGYGTAVLTRLPVRSSESVKLKSYYAPTDGEPRTARRAGARARREGRDRNCSSSARTSTIARRMMSG